MPTSISHRRRSLAGAFVASAAVSKLGVCQAATPRGSESPILPFRLRFGLPLSTSLDPVDQQLEARIEALLTRSQVTATLAQDFTANRTTVLSKRAHLRQLVLLRNALAVQFLALPESDHELWVMARLERHKREGAVLCQLTSSDVLTQVVHFLRGLTPATQDRLFEAAARAVERLPAPPFLRADPPATAVKQAWNEVFEESSAPTQERLRAVYKAEAGAGASAVEVCWSHAVLLEQVLRSPPERRRLLIHDTVLEDISDPAWLNGLLVAPKELERESKGAGLGDFPKAAAMLGITARVTVSVEVDEDGLFEHAWISNRIIHEHPFGRYRPVIAERLFDSKSLAVAETRAYRQEWHGRPIEFDVEWKLN